MKCWYYDAKKTREQNKEEASEKIKAKQEAKRNKRKEKKIESDKDKEGPPKNTGDNDKGAGVLHKGTNAQLPPKTKQAERCLVQEAFLYSEPSGAARVHPKNSMIILIA